MLICAGKINVRLVRNKRLDVAIELLSDFFRVVRTPAYKLYLSILSF
jgi:hypothetical protein